MSMLTFIPIVILLLYGFILTPLKKSRMREIVLRAEKEIFLIKYIKQLCQINDDVGCDQMT